MRRNWNRCDCCGRFIALYEFSRGALRRLITPDAHGTHEEWETLCRVCAEKEKEAA